MKIVIRKNPIYAKEINSRFFMEYEREFETINDFLQRYSLPTFMKDLFNEEIDSLHLEETSLYSSYLDVIKTGVENEHFEFAYLLKSDLAAYISHHLYLTEVSDVLEINGTRIFPWYYGGPKWYVCDTWGETDEDIISSLKTRPYLEFIQRYKAY